jgi:hypothetical protein
MDLKELKSQYKSLQKKHNLLSFRELNECFEIDRIDRDTDNLLRDVRKIMMDKIISYKRFVEMMINPANAPPMFTLFIKEINEGEKEMLEKVYKNLTELELASFESEIEYDEKTEAKLIGEIFKEWGKIKPDLKDIVTMMRRNWNSAAKKKDKGYFG